MDIIEIKIEADNMLKKRSLLQEDYKTLIEISLDSTGNHQELSIEYNYHHKQYEKRAKNPIFIEIKSSSVEDLMNQLGKEIEKLAAKTTLEKEIEKINNASAIEIDYMALSHNNNQFDKMARARKK